MVIYNNRSRMISEDIYNTIPYTGMRGKYNMFNNNNIFLAVISALLFFIPRNVKKRIKTRTPPVHNTIII